MIKRCLLAIISLVLILSFSSSCINVVFVPSTPTVEGLPEYTLSEQNVSDAKGLLNSAKNQIIKNGINDGEAVSLWNEFIYAYYEIATQANVAYVNYACDTSSETNKNRYLFSTSSYNDVYAEYMKAMQDIHKAEKSKGVTGEDSFFNGVSESDINRILKYSSEIATLENEVTELQVEYGELFVDDNGDFSDEFLTESVAIYKQIVDKNNQIATEYGFDNYYEYASDYVYGRDYSASKLVAFRQNIGNTLPSLVTTLKNELEEVNQGLNDDEKDLVKAIKFDAYDKFEVNYWSKYVNSYEKSNIKNGLMHAFENKNVVFADGQNASHSAFTVNLPLYEKSYCYFGPDYQDVFTVSHEISHYYADLYQPAGATSMDLKEVHSQGNEMLLLNFLEDELDKNVYASLELEKLSGILSTVIICTIIDEFEYFVYTSDVTNYSSADFDAKINQICANYGGVDFVNSLTNINKYWRLVVAEHPLYYVSYATSGVAALNLYVEADISRSSARAIYTKIVETNSSKLGFAGSLTKAGLVSPFSSDAFEKIKGFVNGRFSALPESGESSEAVESAESTEESLSVA